VRILYNVMFDVCISVSKNVTLFIFTISLSDFLLSLPIFGKNIPQKILKTNTFARPNSHLVLYVPE